MKLFGVSDDLPPWFTVNKPEDLLLKGSWNDLHQQQVWIEFQPCLQSHDPTCAPLSEVESFLKTENLGMWVAKNFIDMEEVLAESETLKS